MGSLVQQAPAEDRAPAERVAAAERAAVPVAAVADRVAEAAADRVAEAAADRAAEAAADQAAADPVAAAGIEVMFSRRTRFRSTRRYFGTPVRLTITVQRRCFTKRFNGP
ncbi:MAG TPA: hypothetical protein VFE60_03365 [Roseiarcus sp.]|nr:hypothetical protein [Roseiarcus sp.]